MQNIPQDTMMLVGFVNMKLRDEYPTLEEMCSSLDIDRQWLIEKLAAAGFEYSEENKKFW